MKRPTRNLSLRVAMILASGLAACAPARAGWWDKAWTARAAVTVEASGAANDGTVPVLVRLHSGNFDFSALREDGADLRFVATDDKTVLAHRIERIDALLGEALVWVKIPAGKAGEAVKFNAYYGNATATAVADDKSASGGASLIWSFSEKGAPAADRSGNGNNAANAGAGVDGSLIGGGLRFDGAKAVGIPATASLENADKAPGTLTVWVKPTAARDNGVVYSRRDGRNALVVGFRKGVPYVEVTRAGTVTRTPAADAVALNKWHHLAVVGEAAAVTLYVDGAKAGAQSDGLPALKTKATLGGADSEDAPGFIGELDEFALVPFARTADAVKFAAINQGPDGLGTVTLGAVEHGEASAGGEDHAGYFKVIVDSLTFDGWVVIGILAVMAAASWTLMITKVGYINTGARGNRLFMENWAKLSRNLHTIDSGDHTKVESMGGLLDPAQQRIVKKSPLYRIFEVGAEEIRHRILAGRSTLTAESIEAVRARLDGAMVRETQKIDRLIVILTISISGGPFLGLLGTVVGVMITFAAVAMAGDVNVNAIAPGISAALLATVAGLAVAIPALFGYNYILGRIKDVKADVQVFIDEFITSLAEFYAPDAAHPESEDDRAADEAALDRLAAKIAERLASRVN